MTADCLSLYLFMWCSFGKNNPLPTASCDTGSCTYRGNPKVTIEIVDFGQYIGDPATELDNGAIGEGEGKFRLI